MRRIEIPYISDWLRTNKIQQYLRYLGLWFCFVCSLSLGNVWVDCQGCEKMPCHAIMLVTKTLDKNNNDGYDNDDDDDDVDDK